MKICEKCKEEKYYYYCSYLCCKECEDDCWCPHSCYFERAYEESNSAIEE